MSEDINQKLINEIVVLSKLANPRLREQTLKLIDLYNTQKKQNIKLEKKHNQFLKQIDKRTVAVNASSTQKDKMLRQQSKMASMGEMMDAVAHQWKQPLNSLSMMNDMLIDDFKDGLVDTAYIEDMTQTTTAQIEHMVNTLNEFRTFFRPSKNNEDFSVAECIQSVKLLMKDELIKNNINIEEDIEQETSIHGLINEFKHLFLNLISNSIDSFNEKNIEKRNLYIKSFKQNDRLYITFEDNGGGIPQHVIGSIFKPNVTTKAEGKGTGIGLYMSSQIVQKHNGRIEVKNSDRGAMFTVTIES